MYHSISEPRSDKPISLGYSISPAEFERHLVTIKKSGFDTISLRAFWDGWRNRTPLPRRSVILTFDDGYLDNYTEALPRIRYFGFRACFFLVFSLLDRGGMMGIREAEKLLEAGMEIGSHGMRHDLLAGKGKGELMSELEESKSRLSGALKTEIGFFSLPRGFLPVSLPRLARQAGYRGMCTSVPGFNSVRTDPFRWKRFPIRTGFGSAELAAILKQRGYLLGKIMLGEKVRTLLRRRHRWQRHEV